MRHRRPPSQSWPTFLANHVQQIIRPPPTACGARRGDDASDRRMDRSATSRSVPMRRGAALSDSRSGSCLRGRSRDRGSDGDYPSAHGTTFAVAKRSHRTLYRIRAAGVPRSRHHLQRQRPTTHLEIVHGILQRRFILPHFAMCVNGLKHRGLAGERLVLRPLACAA